MGFGDDLDKFANKATNGTTLAIRAITTEVFRRVVVKTPVDTGLAKGNWRPSIGSVDATVDESALDKSGSGVMAKIMTVVGSFSGVGKVYLCNSLPYVNVLEYGRANGKPGSIQAPNGMVRITLAEIEPIIRKVIP